MSQRTGNSFRTLLAAGGAALAVTLAACSDSGVSGPAMQPQDDGPAVGTPGPSFVESGDPDACYTITFDSEADLAGLTRVTEWSDGSDFHGSEIPPGKVFTIFPGTDWEQGLNLTLVRGDDAAADNPRLFNTQTTKNNPDSDAGFGLWEEDLQYDLGVGGECNTARNGDRTGPGTNPVTGNLIGSGGFADCEFSGHVVIVEDERGFAERGNDGQGGEFTLGTFSAGTFFLKSLESIDNDDFEGPITVSVNGGTSVALTPSNVGGNGVRTKWVANEANEIPVMTAGSIVTVQPASGAIDNIEICGCTGRLGDFVWEDLDRDGQQDGGEPGIEGVTVVLKDGGGSVLATDVTDANGFYEFTGLCAGTYEVSVDVNQPALDGFTPTDPNVGDDATDSDENPATRTYPENDFDDPTIDFGFVTPERGLQGCTPGYWKQEQHYFAWTLPLAPGAGFTAPGFTSPGDRAAVKRGSDVNNVSTQLSALEANKGDLAALTRHAMAALLNATSPDVDYQFTPTEIVDWYNDAVAGLRDVEDLKDDFDYYNNGPDGCPLDNGK